MVKMKRLLTVALVLGFLVGCETVEESQKASEKSEEQVVVIEEQEANTEVDEMLDYLQFINHNTEQYQKTSEKLTTYYTKVQDNPSLLSDEDWLSGIDDFISAMQKYYNRYDIRIKEGKVPEDFEEIHDLNMKAYELTVLSIKTNKEAIVSNNPDLMKEAISYQNESNQNIEKATELLSEIIVEKKLN
jgi:hypothetical protein